MNPLGYKVVFVPFNNDDPSGKPEDFLTGFIAVEDRSEVYGRPAGVAASNDGSLLVQMMAEIPYGRLVIKNKQLN